MANVDEVSTPLYRFYDSDAVRPDPDLADVLADEFEYIMGRGFFFEFSMETKSFYSVLSVVDAWNAPVLIEMGMTTPDSITTFLQRSGLHHLIQDNYAFTAAAERFSVPAGIYIDIYSAAHASTNPRSSILKGVEKYNELQGKKYCLRTLLPLMVCGTISYEDAEEIGYEVIEENSSISEITVALMKVNEDADSLFTVHTKDVGFNVSDIKRALSGLQASRASRLKLLMTYGAETTFAINNAIHISKLCSRETIIGRNDLEAEFLLFIDAIITETNRLATEMNTSAPELAPFTVLRRMLKEGVDPQWVSKYFMGDEWDENHIMALHAGIAQPITSGWL